MIQKIHKLIQEIYPPTSLGDFGLKEQLCIEVVKATVEKACEWLKDDGVTEYCELNDQEELVIDIENLLYDFKKAMEE